MLMQLGVKIWKPVLDMVDPSLCRARLKTPEPMLTWFDDVTLKMYLCQTGDVRMSYLLWFFSLFFNLFYGLFFVVLYLFISPFPLYCIFNVLSCSFVKSKYIIYIYKKMQLGNTQHIRAYLCLRYCFHLQTIMCLSLFQYFRIWGFLISYNSRSL